MNKHGRSAFEDVKSHWANKKFKASSPDVTPSANNTKTETQEAKNTSRPTVIELSSDDDDHDDDHDDDDATDFTVVKSSQTNATAVRTTTMTPNRVQSLVYPRMYLLYSPVYDPLTCIDNTNKAVNPFYITEQTMFSSLATELQSDKFYHKETLFLWSFQFDFEALLPHLELHNTRVSRVIYVFHQQGTVFPPEDPVLLEIFEDLVHKKLLVFCQFQMPPYSSFHCKMILKVNKQLQKCKIIIPSSNFTKLEPKYVQQMVFDSGVMSLRSDSGGSEMQKNDQPHGFRKNFLKFFEIFHHKFKDDHLINEVFGIMNHRADFTYLNGKYDFVFSSSKDMQSGLQLLKKTVSARVSPDQVLTSAPKTKFTVQTSSIGAPLSKFGESTLLEISFPQSLPSLLTQTTKCEVVFPTSRSILRSPLGLLTSGWFHFHHKQSGKIASMYKRWKQSKMLFIHSHGYRTESSLNSDLNVSSTARQYVPSHTKFYIVEDVDDAETCGGNSNNSNNDTKIVRFWMFTTANLSKAAWGVYHIKPVNGVHKFTPPTNFECGVLRVCKKNSGDKIILRNIIDYQQLWNNTLEVNKPAFRDFRKEYEDGVVYCIFDPSKLVPYSKTDTAYCPDEST
ncbi:hypothetical protein ACO0QE_003519 [Hanseniaspora vineae]